MRLQDWAAAPMVSPPPIPFSTDAISATNHSYLIGAIPPMALASDLAAAGLTYSPGRGHGYRQHGTRIDPYRIGEILEAAFADAALVLRYYLDSDPVMLSIAAARTARDRIPNYDRGAFIENAERSRLSAFIENAERDSPHSFGDLDLAAQSLAATGKSLHRFSTRTEAIRRFRPAIPLPVSLPVEAPADVAAFLATFAAGELIARPDLHARAISAGLPLGSHKLYAAARAAGWVPSRRAGLDFFRVPLTATP